VGSRDEFRQHANGKSTACSRGLVSLILEIGLDAKISGRPTQLTELALRHRLRIHNRILSPEG
jgi:hypothetical protein